MSHPIWSHYIVSFDKESINSYKKGLTLVECLPYSTDCSLYVYSSDHLSKPSGGYYYWLLRCGETGWFPRGHTAGGREKADRFENPYSYPYCNHSIHYPTRIWTFSQYASRDCLQCSGAYTKFRVRHTRGVGSQRVISWKETSSVEGEKQEHFFQRSKCKAGDLLSRNISVEDLLS